MDVRIDEQGRLNLARAGHDIRAICDRALAVGLMNATAEAGGRQGILVRKQVTSEAQFGGPN
jgi:hypothetical protein